MQSEEIMKIKAIGKQSSRKPKMISTSRHSNTLAFYNSNGGNNQNDMAAVEEDKIANECNLPKVPRLAPEDDLSYQST